MEQLYIFVSRLNEPSSVHDEGLAARHHAYLADLSSAGILLGSGAAEDGTGRRHAESGLRMTDYGNILATANSWTLLKTSPIRLMFDSLVCVGSEMIRCADSPGFSILMIA